MSATSIISAITARTALVPTMGEAIGDPVIRYEQALALWDEMTEAESDKKMDVSQRRRNISKVHGLAMEWKSAVMQKYCSNLWVNLLQILN